VVELFVKDKLLYRMLKKEIVTCCISYQPAVTEGNHKALRQDSESPDLHMNVKVPYIKREF
jgi:hypothetical protein